MANIRAKFQIEPLQDAITRATLSFERLDFRAGFSTKFQAFTKLLGASKPQGNKYTFGTLSKDETNDRQAVLTLLVPIYQRDTSPIWEMTQMFAKGHQGRFTKADQSRCDVHNVRGTSTAYLIARLKRDAPEIAEGLHAPHFYVPQGTKCGNVVQHLHIGSTNAAHRRVKSKESLPRRRYWLFGIARKHTDTV